MFLFGLLSVDLSFGRDAGLGLLSRPIKRGLLSLLISLGLLSLLIKRGLLSILLLAPYNGLGLTPLLMIRAGLLSLESRGLLS